MACDNSIAIYLFLVHAEVVASVSDEFVIFDEAALVEQKLNALSCSKLVLSMLLFYTLDTTTEKSVLIDLVPSLHEACLG